MLSVSVVHAPADAAVGGGLRDYLLLNCPVEIDTVEVHDRDLIGAMGRALGSDVAVVVLSSSSVPARMPRERWEPVFGSEQAHEHGTAILYVPVTESAFPKVLLRTNVYPPLPDVRQAARALKRRLLDMQPPALRGYFVRPGPAAREFDWEGMYERFADRPSFGIVGDAASVRAFADRARADFESVFWVDCRGCTLAEAAGELSAQVALRSPGDVGASMIGLRSICGQRRCLIVLEGADEELAGEFSNFGLTSVVIIRPAEAAQAIDQASAARTRAALTGWVNRPGAAPGAGEIRRTLQWFLEGASRWQQARDFARAAIAYYKFNDRLAEAFEILGLICTLGPEREWIQEQTWILESWGVRTQRPLMASREEPGEQLALF